ncbi:hypothetical protein CRG98_014970 [Punica granatum]|uniref:Uncharacterized protein n=1 Tax=Punica granatum TaxID=22663 RepID=A0A2I0K7X6_PUNGR|nr:hypothetical protein CRG98_014970 [Punica granatum]
MGGLGVVAEGCAQGALRVRAQARRDVLARRGGTRKWVRSIALGDAIGCTELVGVSSLWKACQPFGHGPSCRRGRVKTVSGLPAKEGSKYNASFEFEILSRFSTGFEVQANVALESTCSIRDLMEVSILGCMRTFAGLLPGPLLSSVCPRQLLAASLQRIPLDSGAGKLEEEDVPVGVAASVYGGLTSPHACVVWRWRDVGRGASKSSETVLSGDGGSRSRGSNISKIERGSLGAGAVAKPLDLFPYSEPLSNPSSYWPPWNFEHGAQLQLGRCAMHAQKTNGLSPKPLMSPVELSSCVDPNFVSSRSSCVQLIAQLGSVHLPLETRDEHA